MKRDTDLGCVQCCGMDVCLIKACSGVGLLELNVRQVNCMSELDIATMGITKFANPVGNKAPIIFHRSC